MPTKTGNYRPRAGLGLGSQMSAENYQTTRNQSAKPVRNRTRVQSAKPPAVARRPSGRDKR